MLICRNVICRNVNLPKCYLLKCIFAEMSICQIDNLPKCWLVENSKCQFAETPFYEISTCQNVNWSKFQPMNWFLTEPYRLWGLSYSGQPAFHIWLFYLRQVSSSLFGLRWVMKWRILVRVKLTALVVTRHRFRSPSTTDEPGVDPGISHSPVIVEGEPAGG